MAALTPSTANITLGAHLFIVNPSAMDVKVSASRTIRPALSGASIAFDQVDALGKIVRKRVWTFSGLDDGDLPEILELQAEPGALVFVDIYGDTHSVLLDPEIGFNAEGGKARHASYSITLREV